MVWRGVGSTVGLLVAAAALVGCATTTERLDHYADRMTTYNKEAELAQDRAILLNILRASKRRPLSFFELQSVSASGTPSGQVGFSIPLAQNGGATPSTISPQFNLSSGPTVSANYIDTQEFYQGVLKPIPMDTIDFFIQRGIPDNLLFNLFFSKATVRVHPDDKDGAKAAAPEHVFVNNAGHDDTLDGYQRLVTNLLNSGLTTGVEDSDPSDFGPPLTAAEVADPSVLAKLNESKLKLDQVKWCDLTGEERNDIIHRSKLTASDADACGAPPAPAKHDEVRGGSHPPAKPAPAVFAASGYFRVQQKADDPSHKLCFSPTLHAPAGQAREVGAGGCEQVSTKRKATVQGASACALSPGLGDALPSLSTATAAGRSCSTVSYDIDFTPRSTYGVIYYLGEVVRRKLDPDNPAEVSPRVVMVRTASPLRSIGADGCPIDVPPAGAESDSGPMGPSPCRPVFYLDRGRLPGKGYLSVDYDGQTYLLPDRSDRAGMSNEVLDIVSELIALTRSAKDAPTSSLVTLVGH